jgi:hypothetical protein
MASDQAITLAPSEAITLRPGSRNRGTRSWLSLLPISCRQNGRPERGPVDAQSDREPMIGARGRSGRSAAAAQLPRHGGSVKLDQVSEGQLSRVFPQACTRSPLDCPTRPNPVVVEGTRPLCATLPGWRGAVVSLTTETPAKSVHIAKRDRPNETADDAVAKRAYGRVSDSCARRWHNC